MPGYIARSGNYEFPELGLVHVTVRANARNVRARWKGGMLTVSAPQWIEYDRLHTMLLGMARQLEPVKPAPLYSIGQVIELPEMTLEIVRQQRMPGHIVCKRLEGRFVIGVGEQWSMESPDTMRAISKLICDEARRMAPKVLLPRAREVARLLGVQPLVWTISNGHRKVGCCTERGEISLSYVLVLYPLHLRDFVVKHELAHLTELNHSPRFHKICDAYCDGHEADLAAELRAHKIPIIR